MQFEALGPLRVVAVDGPPVTIPSKVQRRLLSPLSGGQPYGQATGQVDVTSAYATANGQYWFADWSEMN